MAWPSKSAARAMLRARAVMTGQHDECGKMPCEHVGADHETARQEDDAQLPRDREDDAPDDVSDSDLRCALASGLHGQEDIPCGSPSAHENTIGMTIAAATSEIPLTRSERMGIRRVANRPIHNPTSDITAVMDPNTTAEMNGENPSSPNPVPASRLSTLRERGMPNSVTHG